MNQKTIFSILQIFLCFYASLADDSVCGDWEQFDNEKCIKLIDKLGILTCNDAKEICDIQQDSTSSLVSIDSLKELEFIRKLINNNIKVADTVWTRYTEFSLPEMNGKFEDNTDKTCATLISGDEINIKWADDEPHDRNNSVICQKMQKWSPSRIQTLVKSQKELNESLTIAMNEIKNVKQNPVPIGFIYVQLPDKPHPNMLWPNLVWEDVSSLYPNVKYTCWERPRPFRPYKPFRPCTFGLCRPDRPFHRDSFGEPGDLNFLNGKTNSKGNSNKAFNKRNTIKEPGDKTLNYVNPRNKLPINKPQFDYSVIHIWKRVK